ncbi:hypothetical protein LB465_02415 [Salegentibacter sp. LM13S]|uniref:hypothetical protein n=1 Tax=Salegentibacter lacus TaxID=2873599 RepID=UPI001CCBB9A2|nr:hypothetical protein [Salegentibacter lacus]MBZ9629618.1 hypothetical protein [Salegentibacter lacus]
MQNDKNEVIIKCKEGKDLALIPIEEYNSIRESLYLLSGENRNVLLDSLHQPEPGIQLHKRQE